MKRKTEGMHGSAQSPSNHPNKLYRNVIASRSIFKSKKWLIRNRQDFLHTL